MGYAKDGEKAKQFVVEQAIGLYRFIDRGVSGKEKKVLAPGGMDYASMMPGGMEAGFIRPMAARGVEESVKMLKKLGKL